jgi:hypothetical protein
MKYAIFVVILWIILLIGEIRCIYKACTCNWEPIGKAEILYTVGACTGLGCIIGFMDIQDK